MKLGLAIFIDKSVLAHDELISFPNNWGAKVANIFENYFSAKSE